MDDFLQIQMHQCARDDFAKKGKPAEVLLRDLNTVINYACALHMYPSNPKMQMSMSVHERVHFTHRLGQEHDGEFMGDTQATLATAFPYEVSCDEVIGILGEAGIVHSVKERDILCPVEVWRDDNDPNTYALIEIDLAQEGLAEKLNHAKMCCIGLRLAADLQRAFDGNLTAQDRADLVKSVAEGLQIGEP